MTLENIKELIKSDKVYTLLNFYLDACKKNDLPMVKFFLSEEVDELLGFRGPSSIASGFVYACSYGSLDVVKYLLNSKELKRHAQIKHNDDEGFRRACSGGFLDLVKYLGTSDELKEHADLNNKNTLTCLEMACMNGRLEVVKYLLTEPKFKEQTNTVNFCNNGLKQAAIHRKLDIMKFLIESEELKEQIDIHYKKDYCFMYICENNMNEMLEYLIFDYKIEKTKEIEKVIRNKPEIIKMFEMRDLSDNLNTNLKVNATKNQKRKNKTKI